jgi:SAM-dependent methyltransferase
MRSRAMRHTAPNRKKDASIMLATDARPDYAAIKQRQQAAWAAGDYAIVGTTLQIVGERLCEAMGLRAGARILDVAAGNGNATLAAARRFADVTSTDYVPELLERGRERAAAERLSVAFQVADAEALPFADGAFDAAVSTFGVMFTPDQEKAASEMHRVVRKGGRIGLANWTPEGFIGQLFSLIGRHVPPPPGVRSPALWGTENRLKELFPGCVIAASRQSFVFRYRSPAHWIEIFRSYYGPVNRTFAALDGQGAERLESELLDLLRRFNRSGDETLFAPSEYLEAVMEKG